ncbi:MAG TPA: DUF3347 domain-containing protein [Flavobacteriaceae bacterium]|nr:DUF3347 domain-containing protein [Flavobacteriaceae bacterium]
MKKVKTTTAIMLMAFVGLTAMSCKDSKKDEVTSSEMHQGDMGTSNKMMDTNSQKPSSKQILADYMALKDALVETDESASAKAGKKLEHTLEAFNVSSYTSDEQEELKEIIEVAAEHAEHISRSDIAHQREHFQMLTKDITDMIEIIGTDNTLYQQYCPMYADDKGGAWLSMEKEIRNPYFGDLMMNCGEVQKEIN